jgi:hypothetical protein
MIFACSGFIAVAATKTPLILTATATLRPRILRYDWSTTGTPTSDQGIEVQVRRSTAAGTSTAYTPTLTDPSDPAATLVAGTNCTIEPTYSAGFIDDRAINPRATYQWAAYSPDDELILAAGAATGIGFQIIGAGGSAGNLLVNAHVRQ